MDGTVTHTVGTADPDSAITTTGGDMVYVKVAEETEEKAHMGMGEYPGEYSGEYESGPISFSEMKAEQAAMEAAMEVNVMASEFPRMVRRIFSRMDVEDKDAALETLATEFVTEARDAMEMESKEAIEDDVDKAVWSTAFVNDLPDGSFLFIESGGKKNGEGKTKPRSLRHFPYKDASGKVDLPHIRNAIARIPQSNAPGLSDTKKRSLQEKARRILQNAQKERPGLFKQVVGALKGVIPHDEPEPADSGLMLWKEADGTYRWLARYSNNFRDEDTPPEIIAAESHKRFVDLVDNKEVSAPDLWLWHVEDWKWGTGNWVAYDDAGFALAGGTVDKGFEPLAEHLMTLDPEGVRVSHGMLKKSIVRDPDDPSIIVEHVTREISPLPAWAAASQLTGFILSKEANMAIPVEKREALQEEWNLPADLLGSLEAANAADKDSADEAGIERKEKDDGAEDTPPVEAEAETQPLGRDELGQVITAIAQTLTTMGQQMATQANDIKELKEARAAEEEETLTDLFQRAIGHDQARIDGRTSQGRAVKAGTVGPRQEPHDGVDQSGGVILTGNPRIDSMVNSLVTGDWTDGLIESQQGVEV